MKKLHIAIIVIGIVFISLGAFHTNLWFDESYTVAIANQSYGDIWKIGGYDVHPVLYYFMLKTLSLVFGSNVLVFRLFSIIPIAILAILGYTHVRKDFGEKCGLLFSFLVLFLPEMTRYASEIRMYSWAMLFVSITAIYAYRLYKDFNNKNLIIFGIFSLLGAYTHYYALMASGLINIILFVYFIKNIKNNKSEFIKFMCVAVVQVGLYIPWMVYFLIQIRKVSSGFWIGLHFPETLIEVINVQYADKLNQYVALVFAIILYIYLGYLIFKAKREKQEIKFGILGILIYVGIILAALVVSLVIMRPILLNRYLISVTGLLAFSIAFFMAKEKNNYITYIFCFVIIAMSALNNYYRIKENYDPSNNDLIQYTEENIKDTDLILHGNCLNGFIIGTKFLDNEEVFYDEDNWHVEDAYAAFGPSLSYVYSLNEDVLKTYHGRIWIIDDASYKVLEELKEIYDINIIEQKYFKTAYNGLEYAVTLVEK